MWKKTFTVVICFICLSILADCKTSGSHDKYGKNPVKALVIVHDQVINTVSPMIFGANLSWRGNGYQTWNPQLGGNDPLMVQEFKNSSITHLRYPGGIEGSYIHWKEMIGSNRRPQIDSFYPDWPNTRGFYGDRDMPNFGPEEFIALCNDTGILPDFILNAGNGTPQEAAEFVAWCAEKNLQVNCFYVGNEELLQYEQVPGMRIAKTEDEYISFYRSFYQKLSELLPAEKIKELNIGAIGLPPDHPLSVRKNWDRIVLGALADQMDFLDIHIAHSPIIKPAANLTVEDVTKGFLASATWVRGMLNTAKLEIRQNAGSNAGKIKISISEYGAWTTTGQSDNLMGALYQADFFNMILREPIVTSANHCLALNHPGVCNVIGTVADPVLSGIRERIFWKSAVGYVFDLFLSYSGQEVLRTETKCRTFDSPVTGLVPAMYRVPLVDAGAYRDKDSQTISVVLLNRDTRNTQTVSIRLPGSNYSVKQVRGFKSNDPNEYNNWNREGLVIEELNAETITIQGVNGADITEVCIEAKPLALLEITLKNN